MQSFEVILHQVHETPGFSPPDDEKGIKFLKSSMKMKVIGNHKRNNLQADTYSLMEAIRNIKINETCQKK